MYVVLSMGNPTKIYMPKCVGEITWPKYAHAQSQFWAVKNRPVTPDYSFRLYARAALAWTKKMLHLEMRNLTLSPLTLYSNFDYFYIYFYITVAH